MAGGPHTTRRPLAQVPRPHPRAVTPPTTGAIAVAHASHVTCRIRPQTTPWGRCTPAMTVTLTPLTSHHRLSGLCGKNPSATPNVPRRQALGTDTNEAGGRTPPALAGTQGRHCGGALLPRPPPHPRPPATPPPPPPPLPQPRAPAPATTGTAVATAVATVGATTGSTNRRSGNTGGDGSWYPVFLRCRLTYAKRSSEVSTSTLIVYSSPPMFPPWPPPHVPGGGNTHLATFQTGLPGRSPGTSTLPPGWHITPPSALPSRNTRPSWACCLTTTPQQHALPTTASSGKGPPGTPQSVGTG